MAGAHLTLRAIASVIAALVLAKVAGAAVTPEQAAALGSTLTAFGAEKAGNADGSIPEYTGGLPVLGAAHPSGESTIVDPFASEKPLRVLTAGSLAAAADQLTEGTKELLRRYPDFRVDVYPTHRTVGSPDWLIANTLKNATAATLSDDGMGLKDALPGLPFPIPQDGREVMWNHRLRYMGRALQFKYESWLVDSSGQSIQTSGAHANWDFPVFGGKHDRTIRNDETLYAWKSEYFAPQRRVGEAVLLMDAVDTMQHPRGVWQYLPGQRRAKQVSMPDDAPLGSSSGTYMNDDAFVYTGLLDRFDVKLLGKREIIVPYNTYRFSFQTKVEDVLKPGHLDPAVVRWELHRVWVVEATLKPGQTHVYGRRVFYVDEDSWTALASDGYGLDGRLLRAVFTFLSFNQDAGVAFTTNHAAYDFSTGAYFLAQFPGPRARISYAEPLPASEWTPDALAGAGVR
jgi:hypothetical protein